MALIRASSSKAHSNKGGKSKTLVQSKAGSSRSKSRVSKNVKAPPPKQQQTKLARIPTKPKKKTYTDEELNLPKLNMITPIGVQKPRGKKKGKVFIDDSESMMTILAMVNADKEGQIESKMMKSRQMEEIREARKKEADARQEQKSSKLEEVKDSMRRKRKRKNTTGTDSLAPTDDTKTTKNPKSSRRVSFA
ncbi:60S ribosomal subunit assembly/export protein [Loxospora ochrophaea]|nr:60S ribosomal subunit assembly/export protein [Loxospora ochrophaea]